MKIKPMKAVLALLGVAVLVSTAARLYLYRTAMPDRVWVEYSEKYQDRDPRRTQDYESVDKDNELFAEERLGWLMASNKDCIVLTRDKRRADVLVSISVIRYINGGDAFGEAHLSIARNDGDVLLVETFHQGRNRNAGEDIAQQPIIKTWNTLCETASRH